MTSDQFAYWLNGFVELNKGQLPTEEQWKSIVEHLQLVFKKVTPPVGYPLPLPVPIGPAKMPDIYRPYKWPQVGDKSPWESPPGWKPHQPFICCAKTEAVK